MSQELLLGQMVIVAHLQGEETGQIESINFKTDKVLVYFDNRDCPHFDSFNMNQVKPYPLKNID